MAVSAVKKEPVKSTEDAGSAAPPPSAGKGKKPLIWLLLALLVVGAAGGAYWFGIRGQAGGQHEARPEPAKPPVFVPLENFTVNLLLEDSPQFLQVGLSLKVSDHAAIELVKLHIPEIRDRILLLLSSKKASELLTLAGKKALAAEIVATVNAIVAPQQFKPDAKKAATESAPAEDPQAAEAEPKDAADGEDKPAPAAAPELPVKSVLFTSFIVQ